MIQGVVEPPKIFLKASAVLERQFLAYCMDSWIKKGVPENAIPRNIGVCMTNLTSKNSNKFPFNFLSYVQSYVSDLLRIFIQINSFDDEIKDLTSERNALASVVSSIGSKDVFNFLSDEGLLPNYAFPESGIILKAVLYRKEDRTEGEENGKRKYEKIVYEYSRSTSSAISEFAPLNNFYVDGRKLTVNQIDLTSAQVEKWRLCPNCSHAQIFETGKDVASCPQCGTPAWADSGQVRSMLKVRMLYSNMDYTRSLISDESDDRQNTFYCKQLMVEVNEDEDISKAFRMDNEEFSFGYEFVKKAVLREINFGESDINGESLTVASFEFGNTFFGVWKPRMSNSHLSVYTGVVIDDMQKNKTKANIAVFALLNDNEEERTIKYEAEWNGFWQRGYRLSSGWE